MYMLICSQFGQEEADDGGWISDCMFSRLALTNERGMYLVFYHAGKDRYELLQVIVPKSIVEPILIKLILGNVILRTRCQIILKDIGDLVRGLIHNEEVTFNQLAEDLFRGLGEDLNQVNTETVEVVG